MQLKNFFILLFICFYTTAFAAKTLNDIPKDIQKNVLDHISLPKKSTHFLAHKSQQIKKISRVIYITLDGVRWQDIFLTHKYLKTFWSKYAKDMKVYGDPKTPINIEVASVPISLPSYQSQMSGEVQPCQDNNCGRITVETFPESLIHHFGFKKQDAVIFASWYEIAYASQHQLGTVFESSGNKPVYDPNTGCADVTMLFLNEEQNKYTPDLLDRFDIYTFAQAMHYLEIYQPRFLWLSLTDADLAAHLGSKPLYRSVLNLYDRMLDIFFTNLETLNLADETMVIITTDHGRGNGKHWTDHGPKFPESKRTWAFVKNGSLAVIDSPNHYSTLTIRPTIEGIFKAAHA